MSLKTTQGLINDLTMNLDSVLKVTTSQFKAVILATTSSDLTVDAPDSATSAEINASFGILQSYQTANSDVGSVRVYGVSKAYAAAAIQAGDYVTIFPDTIGATCGGYVQTLTISAAATATSTTKKVLGIALEDASATNSAITILVNPQLIEVK